MKLCLLACTETNIAYRTSDHLRWQQMDFVVGIEVRLSNNHTVNGVPLTDICDTLQGRYPKDFKFTGWHPHCRCHAVPVLKTEEEMAEDTRRILAGDEPTKGSVNAVRDVPAAFKEWIEDNSDRIEKAAGRGTMPYFIKDNSGTVDRILGMSDNPVFATKVKVGDREYLLKDLIAECRIETTDNGKIYVHPNHGKTELAENLEFARWRAEQFGEEVVLLPNPQNAKSADSYNITRGVTEEYKRSQSPSVSSIDFLLRSGSKQADHIILEPLEMNVDDLSNAIHSRVNRTAIKELRIRLGNLEAVYSREQIIAKGFKIRPEDFLDESVSRNWGARNNPISDAKVAKFFGLNKKTPQEIAIERHAKRDVSAIQQAWNERRIAVLKQAVTDGLLPKQSVVGLSALPQEDLNARIEFLQKRVSRHAARTPEEIADIKERWAEKQLRDKHTRLMADNVLKLRFEYPNDVDFSVLEKIIADNNLTKMREEAKRVAQAIKAVRDEEKALADLIPDAHGWHKTFSLSELKEAHGKIQSTLDYWKAKGYDFATDSKLSILKTELEQKIKFVENPGAFKAGLTAHKTWEVQQKAYQELLNKVETRIETIKLEAYYNTLLGFKTTSKDFSKWMAKAKTALDSGDTKMAKHWLDYADWKKGQLEAKRKGKSTTPSTSTPGGVKFDASEFTQKKKDEAFWFGGKLSYRDRQIGWDEADRYMYPLARQNWLSWDANQREVGYLYTSGSRYINEPLFATYYGSKKGLNGVARNSWADINTLTEMIDTAVSLPKGMWVQHGEDMGAFSARFGVDLNAVSAKTRQSLIGKSAVNKPFTSCGCAKYSGFADYEVVMNIYCPAGTKGIYAEPFSYFGDGGYGKAGYKWKGQSRQAEGYSSSYENEIILQRGSIFRITKIEFNSAEGKWYVDCELIEQPKKMANVI